MALASLESLAQLLTVVLLSTCQQADAAHYSSRLYIGSYSYTSYYYGSYYSSSVVSVGAIIGAVIGGLTFIGLVIGLIVFLCCLRQRRRASAAARAGTTMTVVGTAPAVAVLSPGGYPAGAPAGGLPYDYPKQDGFAGVSSPPPPPYPAADQAAGGAYYNNGYANLNGANGDVNYSAQQVPQYPAQQMPPLPATAGEQRF